MGNYLSQFLTMIIPPDVTVQLDNSVSDLEELQAETLKYAVTIEMICKPIGW